MSREAYRVKKGMVFWFELIDDQSRHTTKKNRPWVVVSVDRFNLDSPTCSIAPCTTQGRAAYPFHVSTHFNAKNTIIMCEQTRVVDQSLLRDYVCMLTDETIEKIDDALAVYYGINNRFLDINIRNVVFRLERVVENIINVKIESSRMSSLLAQEIEESALRLGMMIEDLVTGKPGLDAGQHEHAAEPVIIDAPDVIEHDLKAEQPTPIGAGVARKPNET